MSKDPAFLFYPNDYLGGTMGFNLEQHGAYLLLLIYQFNNGSFSVETACQIVGTQVFESIRHKFTENNGCICNARLMQEIEKRKSFTESRRNNAKKGWKTKKTDAYAMQVHSICNDYALHMGNENENENRIAIEKGGCKGEKQVVPKKAKKEFTPPTMEEFTAYCTEYGYSGVSNRAYRGYCAADWHDSTGKKIINWKQKLQHVWFRPENKSKNDRTQLQETKNLPLEKKCRFNSGGACSLKNIWCDGVCNEMEALIFAQDVQQDGLKGTIGTGRV